MKQSEFNKLINEVAKAQARSRGWKFSRGFIFQRCENLFFCLIITGNAKARSLNFIFSYKWYDSDDLFWKIVKLPENTVRPLSFRAGGAWTAPMSIVQREAAFLDALDKNLIVCSSDAIFDAVENLKLSMSERLRTLDDDLKFLDEIQAKHLLEYPGSVRTNYVQKVLSLMLKGDNSEALKQINERISVGDSGGFGLGGKTFFTAFKEYLLNV